MNTLTAISAPAPEHFAPEFDAAALSAAFAAAAPDQRLTSTDKLLYAAVAALPETPPAAELAAYIGKKVRTVWYGLKRLARYGYIEETGSGGYRNRVRQWTARIKNAAAAIPAAAAAAGKKIRYGKGPVTDGQKKLIDDLQGEILQVSKLNAARLKGMVAKICDLESGPETAGQANQLIGRLKQIKTDAVNGKYGRPSREQQRNREPGRYTPLTGDRELDRATYPPDYLTR